MRITRRIRWKVSNELQDVHIYTYLNGEPHVSVKRIAQELKENNDLNKHINHIQFRESRNKRHFHVAFRRKVTAQNWIHITQTQIHPPHTPQCQSQWITQRRFIWRVLSMTIMMTMQHRFEVHHGPEANSLWSVPIPKINEPKRHFWKRIVNILDSYLFCIFVVWTKLWM